MNTIDINVEALAPSTDPAAEVQAVRGLMCAVEFMRRVCEHVEVEVDDDDESGRLALARAVGIKQNAAMAHLISDYQQESFWRDVDALPALLDLKEFFNK